MSSGHLAGSTHVPSMLRPLREMGFPPFVTEAKIILLTFTLSEHGAWGRLLELEEL